MTKQLTEDEKERLAWKLKGLSELQIKLYHTLKQNPGIHFRGLGRIAQMTSAGRLRHHIDRLLKRELIKEARDGRFKRYFVVGDHELFLERAILHFSRPIARKIGELLLQGPMEVAELCHILGCSQPVFSYHARHLLLAGDVKREAHGNFARYCLVSPELVRQALALMAPEADDEPESSEPATH